jgi:hypothetical protein
LIVPVCFSKLATEKEPERPGCVRRLIDKRDG